MLLKVGRPLLTLRCLHGLTGKIQSSLQGFPSSPTCPGVPGELEVVPGCPEEVLKVVECFKESEGYQKFKGFFSSSRAADDFFIPGLVPLVDEIVPLVFGVSGQAPIRFLRYFQDGGA